MLDIFTSTHTSDLLRNFHYFTADLHVVPVVLISTNILHLQTNANNKIT